MIVFTVTVKDICSIIITTNRDLIFLQAILQIVDKLPTISTQLKIIAAVKATRQGGNGK